MTTTMTSVNTYDLETSGDGWVWSGRIRAESVEAAVAAAASNLMNAVEIEAETEDGLLRFDLDLMRAPSDWTINNERCVVEEIDDNTFEVSVLRRSQFQDA